VLLAELDAASRGDRVLVLELALVAGGDGRLVGVLAGGGAVVLKVAAAVCGAVGRVEADTRADAAAVVCRVVTKSNA
jgi:hypothetical protein